MTTTDDTLRYDVGGPTAPEIQSFLGRLVAAFGSLRAAPAIAYALDRVADDVAARLALRARRRRARFEILPREALPAHAADVALALRALQGDPLAVREIRGQVESLIIGRIHARGLGANENELLGLIMGRVWDKLVLYQGKSSLRTWSWTVAENYLRNWLRDQRVQAKRFVSLDASQNGAPSVGDVAAAPGAAADRPLLEGEREARTRVLVQRITQVAERRIAERRLKAADWQLVLQVIVNGERYDVLARAEGTSPGALRVRVFRALEGLRDSLREELGPEVRSLFEDHG